MTSVKCGYDKCIFNNRGYTTYPTIGIFCKASYITTNECTLSYVNLNKNGECMDAQILTKNKER